jgi:folate-binding protein YgfZ
MSESVIDPITPEVADSYDLLRVDCGRFPTEDLAIVALEGEDRKGWLQGQATNNLRSMDLGASSAFCICEPTGQIVSICELWSLQDRFVITMAHSALPGFMKRVEQMVILESVSAAVLTDYRLFSIQGPGATYRVGDLMELPKLDAGETDFEKSKVALLRSNRAGLGGWDILVPVDAKKAISKLESEFEPIHPDAAEIIRIEAGIPKFGQDTNAKTMPPELGPAFDARHVSYNKGCYTGQEVLTRIKSRGHTNRSWVGLLAEQPLEVGAPVSHPKRSDAGEVTSAAYSPAYGFIGAAMLRSEAALPGGTVSVQTKSGPVEASVREMPILRFE